MPTLNQIRKSETMFTSPRFSGLPCLMRFELFSAHRRWIFAIGTRKFTSHDHTELAAPSASAKRVIGAAASCSIVVQRLASGASSSDAARCCPCVSPWKPPVSRQGMFVLRWAVRRQPPKNTRLLSNIVPPLGSTGPLLLRS